MVLVIVAILAAYAAASHEMRDTPTFQLWGASQAQAGRVHEVPPQVVIPAAVEAHRAGQRWTRADWCRAQLPAKPSADQVQACDLL